MGTRESLVAAMAGHLLRFRPNLDDPCRVRLCLEGARRWQSWTIHLLQEEAVARARKESRDVA